MLSLLYFLLSFQLSYSRCPEIIEYESLDEYKSTYGETATSGVRVNLTDAMNSNGAACLDGSVGVFYYRKGSGSGANKFHVFLEGGGACAGIETQVIASLDSCAHRAGTSLGSSTTYAQTANFDSGYLSTDESTNPLTYNWNTAYVKYCDGSCYSSDNDTTVKVSNDLTLYFRGFRILQGVFDELMKTEYGYANSTDLLLSGCSAGGLGTFLHMDYIYHNKLPEPTHMGAMPDSGFFLEYEGKGQLMTGVKWEYDNMNTTASLNPDCIAAQAKGYEYLCMFAQEVVPFSFVNVFALQSRFDTWQTGNELDSNNDADINTYGNNLTQTIIDTYLTGSKHDMFLDSCAHHCGEWDDIRIDGYLAKTAQYEWYHEVPIHAPLWFQNDTYPCKSCCTA